MSKAKRLSTSRNRPPKLTILYIFLIPMFISVAQSLFKSDLHGFILKIVGFAMLYGAISLAKKGFLYKEEYERSKLAKAPKTPFLKYGAIALGITLFYISFFVAGHSLINALFIGVIATAGFYLYYGFDPTEDKIDKIDGISADLVIESINKAKNKLIDIKNGAKKIDDTTLSQKLDIAIQKADSILDTIQEDPKDIRVARKFLVVYIDGIGKVVESYTKLDEGDIDLDTKERLYRLMDDVQNRFDSELDRLKRNNQFDLDVHIDVLKKQIKH